MTKTSPRKKTNNKSYVDVTLVIGVKLGYNIKSKHNF